METEVKEEKGYWNQQHEHFQNAADFFRQVHADAGGDGQISDKKREKVELIADALHLVAAVCRDLSL